MPNRPPPRAHNGTRKVLLLCPQAGATEERLLRLLESHLIGQGFVVCVDRLQDVGIEWATELEWQICTSEAVIPLLSAASLQSEILAYEIERAAQAAHEQAGRPRLLPVRLPDTGPLPENIAAVLDHSVSFFWQSEADDALLPVALTDALQTSLTPAPVVMPFPREAIGGAVPLDSHFYMVRPTDAEFHSAISRQDSIVLVKGARQMGKTSLLARGLQQARIQGAKVVLTDFQAFNAAQLKSAETIYMTLAAMIADQLDLDALPSETWNAELSPNMNLERFLRRKVLSVVETPIVWGLDEVDRLFAFDFASEVFGMFRSWHNKRALDPAGPWSRLSLAIAYATEAHLFITDVNQSPFNVGTRLTLDDFNGEQVAELNRRYGQPLCGAEEVAVFHRLLGGSPYLTRRALDEMAAHGISLAQMEKEADRDDGIFGDHLRRILITLSQDTALTDVVRTVLEGGQCASAEAFYRLRSAGLMVGGSPEEMRPRCQLYATYLARHLKAVDPETRRRIQQRKDHLKQMMVEIDQERRENQVEEITSTEFFQQLQERVRRMRCAPQSNI